MLALANGEDDLFPCLLVVGRSEFVVSAKLAPCCFDPPAPSLVIGSEGAETEGSERRNGRANGPTKQVVVKAGKAGEERRREREEEGTEAEAEGGRE